MTTSPTSRRIWVVGTAGAGKRSFVAALGAVASPRGDYAWAAARATLVLRDDAVQWRHSDGDSCVQGDVVVLLYDVTDRASFQAVARDWAPLVSAQNRMLLVGTKIDRVAERRVPASEAMELALVECDDHAEVCATQPPFDGVAYSRQLLASWLAQDDPSLSPDSPDSPSRRHTISTSARSSVWLYDPTEEMALTAQDDVKLRPISRALFEMREASGDRLKMQERRREQQATAKLVTRSRYHGPTESSRSMRWQAHQLQLQQQHARLSGRRQSTADVDLSREHAKLEHKSFLQPTKLMKQRVDEIKHKLLATDKPSATGQAKLHKKRPSSRQRAMSTAPSRPPPAAPVLKSHACSSRPRAPSLSPPRPSRSVRHSLGLPPSEIESDEFTLDLTAPPLAPLTLSPVTRPTAASKELPPPPPPPSLQNEPEHNAIADQIDTAGNDNGDAFNASEIDDMLDYFDGVALPI